jgi:hypothetical protein
MIPFYSISKDYINYNKKGTILNNLVKKYAFLGFDPLSVRYHSDN